MRHNQGRRKLQTIRREFRGHERPPLHQKLPIGKRVGFKERVAAGPDDTIMGVLLVLVVQGRLTHQRIVARVVRFKPSAGPTGEDGHLIDSLEILIAPARKRQRTPHQNVFVRILEK